MKIVILDNPLENPGEIDWSGFYEYGEVVRYEYEVGQNVAERIGDADVVFLNKSKIKREDLEKCPNLKFISIIATGYNAVDVKAARELGISVANVPSYGTEAIGQHAIALLMEITNHVAHHDQEVRKGRKHDDSDWAYKLFHCFSLHRNLFG